MKGFFCCSVCKTESRKGADGMNSGKRNERLMLTAVFLFWFSVYTYPSFLTTYVTNTLGAAKVMAGMIVGSYGLTQMLLRIPLGILSDVMKKRKLFVVIGFVLSIGSSAGLTAAAMLAGQENVPDAKRGAAMGIVLLRQNGVSLFTGFRICTSRIPRCSPMA